MSLIDYILLKEWVNNGRAFHKLSAAGIHSAAKWAKADWGIEVCFTMFCR
jgi:hypothetical protein